MNSKKLLYIGVTAVLVLSVLAMFTAGASAEEYTFVTKWGSFGTGDGEFYWPHGIAVDSSGYVFVVDTHNDRIQKFDSVGNFITKWGSSGTGDGEFYWPDNIAVDSSGYVYVADTNNHRIQKFDSDGNFITKWGCHGSGDGEFYWPEGIAVDSSGYVYVADTINHRIQKFDSVGNFITKWGSFGTGDGEFYWPRGIAVDSSGYVYVANKNNDRIQKFDSVGNFITKWGCHGSGDGEFYYPYGIAVDSSGYVYVADSANDRIQKFDSVGTFITKWGSWGTGDGEFDYPEGIAVDSSGYVYVADTKNARIQKFAPGIPEDPSLSFTPSSHDFGDKCEGDTDCTTFAIWNSGTGTLTYSLSESCGWVEVNPTSGSSTGEHDTITVDIDTTGLSEGPHTCDITISSNDGSGTFTATVNVVPCEEPVLSYSPTAHNFGDKCEGETDSTTFAIWNSGTGTLTYTLSESCGWVDVNPTSGSSTGEHDTITVEIDTTGLSEGLHTCDIYIDSNDGSGTFTVTVNVVPCEEPVLSYSPASHDFGDMCEGVTDSTTFEIWNSGTGTLTYTLSESCGWVDVNPTSGSSTGEHDTITVEIDTTGLSEGLHTCDISISSNGGSGTFTVTVNVVPCEEPVLSYSPTAHNFGDKCEGETDSTTFAIWNSGTGTLTYSLSETCGWVEVNPTSGSSTGEHDTITVDIDTTGLSEGSYTCDISVSSNDGSGTFTVTVNIIGELRTFITTDKYEYHPGDTMTMTVDIENPTASSVDTYFVLLLILPEYSYYQPMLVTRLTLPPYFDQTYNNDLYVGNWATIEFDAEWYVALLETSAPYDIICDDTAEWRYDHPVITRDKGTSKGGSAPSEEVVPEQIADAIMKSIGEIALPVEHVQEEEITEEISDAILD